jgi:hypothetical protein
MSDTPIGAADYLKFATALVGLVEAELAALEPVRDIPSTVMIEASLCRLASTQSVLGAVIEAFDDTDPGHYADGRPIASHVRFGDGTQYVYPSHPDPTSPANEPQELTTVTTRNGTRKRIVVSAPGHLDSITLSETPEPSREVLPDGECHL